MIKWHTPLAEDTYYSEPLEDKYGLSLNQFKQFLAHGREEILELKEIDVFLEYEWSKNHKRDSFDKDPVLIFLKEMILEDSSLAKPIIMKEEESGEYHLLDGGHRLLTALNEGVDAEIIVIPEIPVLVSDYIPQEEWVVIRQEILEKLGIEDE